MCELALRTILGICRKSAESLFGLCWRHRLPWLFLMRKILPTPSILEILLYFFDSSDGIRNTAFLNVSTRLAFWETVAILVFSFIIRIIFPSLLRFIIRRKRLFLMWWRFFTSRSFPITRLFALFSWRLFVLIFNNWWQLYPFCLDFLLIYRV